MDFQKFKNRYVITGELTVETALHIGSGVEENGHDAPFIKYENGEFYIPGSTMRGYLRTKLERFLNLQNELGLKYKGEQLNSGDVMLLFGYTNLTKVDEEIQNRILKMLNEKKENIENVNSLAGRIFIPDLPVLTESYEITRDGIKIDEETGTVAEGAKFDYNVLPSGTKFRFELIGENIEEYQLDLLKLALIDIEKGDIFGGKTSRGIGKCILALDKEAEVIRSSNKEELKKYILEGKTSKVKTSDILSIKNIEL